MFAYYALLLGRFQNMGAQHINVQRFFEVRHRALLHRLDGRVHRTVTRKNQDLDVGPVALRLLDDLQAVHVVHDQVGQHEVDVALANDLEPLRAGRGGPTVAADALQGLGRSFSLRAMVVYDENTQVQSLSRGGGSGGPIVRPGGARQAACGLGAIPRSGIGRTAPV